MTPIAKLLKQKPSLWRRAFAQTRDVNEAYLLVHDVMARALNHGGAPETDLGPAMACALARRSRRLGATQCAI